MTVERGHIVCANVDRIFIVVAVSDPPYNRSFIDRLIVGVERDALSPVVVVNKIDMADGSPTRSWLAIWRSMERWATRRSSSAPRPVRGSTRCGRHSAAASPPWLGRRGVGKSSLLNLVSPGASLLIGRVSDHDGRGRHTTTAAELLPLVDGPEGRGFVIDTPGLGDFGLGDIRADELMAGFREDRSSGRRVPLLELRAPGGAWLRRAARRRVRGDRRGAVRELAQAPRRDQRRRNGPAGHAASLSRARECQAAAARASAS